MAQKKSGAAQVLRERDHRKHAPARKDGKREAEEKHKKHAAPPAKKGKHGKADETPSAKVKRGDKEKAPKQAKKGAKAAGDEEGDGVEVEGEEPEADAAAIPDAADEEEATPAERAEREEEEDAYSKSNDPVRMYLRKMGSVSLLTREGEVEIAKRIEDGEKEVLEAVLHSSIAIKEIIQIGERLKKGKMRVREGIRDAPDEDDETFDEQGRTEQVVKLIEKIRRLDRENEHFNELMGSKTRKVSDNKRKEYRDAILRNEQSMAETLSEAKLNKRQIERIIENLKRLIERVYQVEQEMRQIEHRVGVPLRELKSFLREAEDEGKS